MLKDLTAQVNRLKDEYGSLSEESREVISLQAAVDSLYRRVAMSLVWVMNSAFCVSISPEF